MVEELPVVEEVPEPIVEIVPEPVVEEVSEPVVEAITPPSPDVAQTGVDQIRGVDREDLIKQTVNAISNTKFTDREDKEETLGSKLQNSELNALKKQIANIMTRLGTLSMGGGGTGVVRIGATDDFDSSTYGEGRVLKWTRNAFRLADNNANDLSYNTTLVTTSTYTVLDSDYYIGVNTLIYNYNVDDMGNQIVDSFGNPIYSSTTDNGTATIYLPATATNGRNLIIKDERGDAQNNNIIISGNVDNDAGGVILAINNGGLHLLYRDGWRIV